MSKILPLRNVSGPPEPVTCEICHEENDPRSVYPIINGEQVDGYVCIVCFELMGEQEQEPYAIN